MVDDIKLGTKLVQIEELMVAQRKHHTFIKDGHANNTSEHILDFCS